MKKKKEKKKLLNQTKKCFNINTIGTSVQQPGSLALFYSPSKESCETSVPARMVNNDGRGAWSVFECVAMRLHQQICHIGSIQAYNSQNKIKYIT